MITTPPPATESYSHFCLTITRGLPGSGKTTWAFGQLAKRPHGTQVRVNRDDMRRMLFGTPRCNREAEVQITILQHSTIRAFLMLGKSVIVDDTNLDHATVDALHDIALGLGVSFHVQDFRDVPVDVCVDRDRGRTGDRHVGEDIIRDMHARYLADPSTKEPK